MWAKLEFWILDELLLRKNSRKIGIVKIKKVKTKKVFRFKGPPFEKHKVYSICIKYVLNRAKTPSYQLLIWVVL